MVNYQIPSVAIAQSAEGLFGSSIETSGTMVRFVWKGGGVGAGAVSVVAINPKKGIEIPGVVENKKFKEYVTPNREFNTSYSGLVISHRKDVVVSHVVKADREAFKAKSQQALNEYLDYVVDIFIKNANG